MPKFYNQSINEDLVRKFNFKGTDSLPAELMPLIQAVIPITPAQRIAREVVTTATSGGSTIFTTPADKDFYLTNAYLTYSKNATNDTATGDVAITVIIDGATRRILGLSKTTLIQETASIAQTFNPPLKIDRNTAISRGSFSFTAGAGATSSGISGYTEEVTKT